MNEFFLYVLTASFHGAIAGAVILLVRRLTRNRWRSRWHTVLWMILLIKLLLPEGSYCFVSAYRVVPEIPTALVFEVPDQTNAGPSEQPAEDLPARGAASAVETLPPRAAFRVAAIVWASGAVLLGGWYVLVTIRFRRRISRGRHIPVPQELSALLAQCRRQMHLRRTVKLIITEEVQSPCVYGCMAPTILVPPKVMTLGASQQEHLLIHELCHCRRWDPLTLFVATALQCVHWFNPVLWVCFRILRQDLELATDEMVITYLGPTYASAYGRSLLSVAECCAGKASLMPPAMGMAEKKSQLEIRIRRICMNRTWKKRGILSVCVALLCVVGLAIVLLSGGRSTPAESAAPSQSGTTGDSTGTSQETGETVPEEPGVVVIQNTFGFADESGSTLILPAAGNQPEDPERIDTAIGTYGTILPVTYAGQQEGTAQDTGRFTADNFPNIPGQLYTVADAAAVPNETYYLVDSEKFDLRAFLPVAQGDHSPADGQLTSQLEAEVGRLVQNSWLLGTAGSETSIYLVLFAAEGEDLLASIVAKTPDGLLRHDYPATLNGASAWRVDDSGTMDPGLFHILFAAQADDQLLLGLTWLGAEGQSTVFLKQEDSALEELDILFYRYTAIA